MAGEIKRLLFSEGVSTTKPTNLVPNTQDGLEPVSISDADSPITLVLNRRYFADTSSGTIVATLPVGGTTGDRIQIIDNTGNFQNNSVTVLAGVGDTVDGLSVVELETEDQVAEYIYDSANSNWVVVAAASSSDGSGTGEINYILNPGAETNTDGWVAYADAAGSDPVDGTGGSPTVAIQRTTTASEIERGEGSFTFTNGGADRQGEGVSYNFTIDNADRNKLLKISMDYTTTGGYESGDVGVYIYDVTNMNLIEVSNNDLNFATNGSASLQFVSSDSTSYRLILHVKTTNAVSYQMFFDNVIVGPGSTTIAQGAIITSPTVFTPNFSNGTFTFTNNVSTWHREGQNMVIKVSVTATSSGGTGNVLSVDIPDGQLADSGLIFVQNTSQNSQGHGSFYDASSGVAYVLHPTVETTSSIKLNSHRNTTDRTLADNEVANGDRIHFHITIPIDGWADTGVVILPTTDDLSITSPQSYTSTLGNLPSGTQNLFYWREGTRMRITGNVATGGAATGNISITIPSGFNIDYSKLGKASSAYVGVADALDVSAPGHHKAAVLTNGSSSDTLIFVGDDGANTWNATVPFTWTSGDDFNVDIDIPVEEWANIGSVPAVAVEEATSETLGTVKANKWQVKLLNGDITSDADPDLADLTFNNLVIGRTYKVTARPQLDTGAGDDNLTFQGVHDGNNLINITHNTSGSSLEIHSYTTDVIFVATATTFTFATSGASTTSAVRGNNTTDETWVRIEEMNNYKEETTDFS